MIVLSGCEDRLCSLVLDDQLHLQVSNSEGKSPIMKINDDGWEEALPRVLTVFFRPGDNVVQANLYDLAGDKRGTHTPIYILILR
jgi:hypothetical protein